MTTLLLFSLLFLIWKANLLILLLEANILARQSLPCRHRARIQITEKTITKLGQLRDCSMENRKLPLIFVLSIGRVMLENIFAMAITPQELILHVLMVVKAERASRLMVCVGTQ